MKFSDASSNSVIGHVEHTKLDRKPTNICNLKLIKKYNKSFYNPTPNLKRRKKTEFIIVSNL